MKNFTDPGIIELITKIKGDLPKIATTTTAGITKPDGTTVTVDANGKTSVTISNLTAKSTVADGDSFMIGDSADSTVKKTLFSTIKTTLATTFATLANRQTFTGAKAFSKGLISYGNDSTTLPTDVGDYIAVYDHDTYGLRFLGYNGTAYRPFTLGAMISTGVFAMQILANGDVLVNGRLRLPSLSADPTGSLIAGMSYYNSTDKVMKYYDGTAWKKIGGGTAAETTYSNTTSGMTATNVQAAVDEVHNEAKVLDKKIGGVRPGVVTAFSVSAADQKVNIKFTEPSDTTLNGAMLSNVKGCKIVMKAGTDPIDENDGTVVLYTEEGSGKPLGYYSNTSGEVSGLTNGTAYHFKAFPYSYDNIYYRDDTNVIIATPKSYVLYGFCIDPNNSDPAAAVTYEDMAEGMTPGKMNFTTGLYEEGSWTNQIFFLQNNHVYMVKSNGTLDYQLNDNDYTQKADGSGSSAVSDTGYDGNAMVRFDTVWMYQYTDTSGKFHCKICNIKLDNNYHAYAHQRTDGSIMNYILLAAFKGSLTSSKIRSLNGQSVMNTQTGANEITYATNNGSLWYTRTHAQRNLINMLLILVGKSLSCETVFGQGHTSDGTAASSMLTTGTLSNKGRFFGTNTNAAVKVFHLENWWGDQWERIAGLVTNGSTHPCVKMEKPYNTAGTGYTDLGYALGGTSGGYISAATMNEYGGLVPKTASGSTTTYYCDGLWLAASCYALVGGNCDSGLLCGPFALILDSAVSRSGWNIGAALSCEQPA